MRGHFYCPQQGDISIALRQHRDFLPLLLKARLYQTDQQLIFESTGHHSVLAPHAATVAHADNRNITLMLRTQPPTTAEEEVVITGLSSVTAQAGDIVQRGGVIGTFDTEPLRSSTLAMAFFRTEDGETEPVRLYVPCEKITSGEKLFEVHCTSCHSNGYAPELKGLSERKLAATGEKPTSEDLLHGLNTAFGQIPDVPPFDRLLSEAEKKVLVVYLMTL